MSRFRVASGAQQQRIQVAVQVNVGQQPANRPTQLLANLAETYAALRPHLFDETGKLRSFVNVYINDEDYRYLEREDTAVRPDDVVSIVPAIAGGVR